MSKVVPIRQIEYPKWLDQELWIDFLEMRKEIKKPLTERAERRAIRKLGRLIDEGAGTQEEIVEQSIINNWQDLYPYHGKKEK